MRVYEAIVKGLEGVGVEAAFGGAGENAAGLMLALKHSDKISAGHHPPRAGRVVHGLRLRDVHRQARVLLRDRGTGRVQPVLGAGRGDVGLLPRAGGLGLRLAGVEAARGSLNETSGLNRTPDSQEMFEATTKESFLLTDIDDTCDVLEEAVNLAFEGRPGPVHIHVPENLTHHGVEVRNYHDIRLDVRAGHARPGTRRGGRRRCWRTRSPRGKKVVALVGFGAIRSGAGAEVKRLIERFQIPLLTTLDGKGIVSEGHPLCVGRVLRQRSRERVEGVPEGRRRAVHRQLAQPARHVQLPRGPVRRQAADPHQHLRGRDRQGLQGRLRDRLGRTPGGGRARRRARAEGRRGPRGRRRRHRTTRPGTSCT